MTLSLEETARIYENTTLSPNEWLCSSTPRNHTGAFVTRGAEALPRIEFRQASCSTSPPSPTSELIV